jgi:hypothetical protein
MKTKAVASLLILCAAFAIGAPKAVYYLHTGLALPMSPPSFKDSYGQGFNVGAIVGLRFNPKFELQAALDLNNCAFENQGFSGTLTELSAWKDNHPILAQTRDPYYTVEGNSSNAWSLFINAKRIFPPQEGGKVESYFFAGAGVFGLKKGDITATDSEEEETIVFSPSHVKTVQHKYETTLAVNFGIGFDVLLEQHTNFYVQLGPTIGFTKGDPTVIIPITFGVSIRP